MVFVVQNAQIAAVALRGNFASFYGSEHGALRLVGVGAGIKLAVFEEGPHFGEMVTELVAVDIDDAELLDAGRIDDLGVLGGFKQFSKGGSVLAFL